MRGLRPGFDEIGMFVLNVDEVDALIQALMSRAGAVAEQILADDGFGPEECKLASCLPALRAHRRLAQLPVEELRRRGALIGALAGC